MSLHDAHEEEDELENQNGDNRRFEKLAANHAECSTENRRCRRAFSAFTDVVFHLAGRAGADEREQSRCVDIADDLQRVFASIGQLVDVDEQRVHLPRSAGVVPSRNASYHVRAAASSRRCRQARCPSRRNSGIGAAVSCELGDLGAACVPAGVSYTNAAFQVGITRSSAR